MDHDPYRRRNSYGWSYDDDEEGDFDSDDSGVASEKSRRRNLARTLVDPQGRKQDIRQKHLRITEILGLTTKRTGHAARKFTRRRGTKVGGAVVSSECIVIWPRRTLLRASRCRGTSVGHSRAIEKMVRVARRAARIVPQLRGNHRSLGSPAVNSEDNKGSSCPGGC